MATTANDRQIGGDHYKGGEEHWDRVARLGLDYFQGQITKYVERCWKKNGVEDLKKAEHFIQKYLELSGDRLGEAQMRAGGTVHMSLEVYPAEALMDLKFYHEDDLVAELARRGAGREKANMAAFLADEGTKFREPPLEPGPDPSENPLATPPPFDDLNGKLARPGERGPICKVCGQFTDSGHAPNCPRAAGGPIERGAFVRAASDA